LKGAGYLVGLFFNVLKPRRKATAFDFFMTLFRGLFTNWFIVGIFTK